MEYIGFVAAFASGAIAGWALGVRKVAQIIHEQSVIMTAIADVLKEIEEAVFENLTTAKAREKHNGKSKRTK